MYQDIDLIGSWDGFMTQGGQAYSFIAYKNRFIHSAIIFKVNDIWYIISAYENKEFELFVTINYHSWVMFPSNYIDGEFYSPDLDTMVTRTSLQKIKVFPPECPLDYLTHYGAVAVNKQFHKIERNTNLYHSPVEIISGNGYKFIFDATEAAPESIEIIVEKL